MQKDKSSFGLNTKDIDQREDIFVVVTCKVCPHSKDLKDRLPVIKCLANTNGLIYVHMEVDIPNFNEIKTIEISSPSNLKINTTEMLEMPKRFSKFLQYFPILMIFPKETWYGEDGWFHIYGINHGINSSELVKESIYPRNINGYSYNDMERWIKSLTSNKNNKNNNEIILDSIDKIRNNLSETDINKISQKIIKLKHKKKEFESEILRLESMEMMFKTIKNKSNDEIRDFLEGTNKN